MTNAPKKEYSMEELEVKYNEVTSLYDYAEELVATVESQFVQDPNGQLDIVEPLINEIGDATDVLAEEFIRGRELTIAVLGTGAQADRHKLNLEQAIPIERTALVTYSPVTERVPPGGTLTLRELCRAAVSISDNTAANLALDAIGGARTFTAFMRSIGDDKTRLDRREPELNEATPGDARDTTTPIAAARSLQTLLLDGVLSAPARNELTQWMLGDQVADALLRAGLPRDWQIADKSGAGGHGSRSIIAVVWPPKRSAVIVAIYITQTAASMSASNQAVSRIGSALAKALQ